MRGIAASSFVAKRYARAFGLTYYLLKNRMLLACKACKGIDIKMAVLEYRLFAKSLCEANKLAFGISGSFSQQPFDLRLKYRVYKSDIGELVLERRIFLLCGKLFCDALAVLTADRACPKLVYNREHHGIKRLIALYSAVLLKQGRGAS